MKSKSLFYGIMLVLLLVPILNESYAQEPVSEDPTPIVYDSGIDLISIGEIDEKDGTYWLDFFFYMKSDDVDFNEKIPEIVFMNARNIELGEPYVTQNYYEIRVKGNFVTQLDFVKFPYEQHKLVVEIEPKIPYDTSRFVFGNNTENLIDTDMRITSNFKMFDSEVIILNHTYFDGLEFSQLIISYTMGPEPIGSTLKTIIPVTIIVGISLLIFLVPEHYTPRSYLAASLLLSVVYWHQTSLDHLPSLGYTTIFDKLMLFYYILFVNSILSIAVQMRVSTKDKNDIRAKKYNKFFGYVTIGIIIVGIIWLAFAFNN